MTIVERGNIGSVTQYYVFYDNSVTEKVWTGTVWEVYATGHQANYAKDAVETAPGRFHPSVTVPSRTRRWELRERDTAGVVNFTLDGVVAQGESRDLSEDAVQFAMAAIFGVTNVWFVDPVIGADTNTGRSPQTAFKSVTAGCSVAVRGDMVYFNNTVSQDSTNPDLYDAPSLGAFLDIRQVRVPAGVWLKGANRTTAKIYTDFDGTGSVAVTAAGDDVRMSDFTIVHVFGPSGSLFTTPLGYNANPTKNVEGQNILVSADSDGIYHNSSTGQGTGRWRYYNCILSTKYDAAVILGTNVDQEVECFNCEFNVVGPSLNNIQNIGRAVTGQQGIMRLFNCIGFVTTTDETITNDINVFYPRTGSSRAMRLVCTNCRATTKVSGTYVGNNSHFRCDTGAVLVIADCAYDAHKTINLDGNAGVIIENKPINAVDQIGRYAPSQDFLASFATRDTGKTGADVVNGSVVALTAGAASGSSVTENIEAELNNINPN